MTRRIVAAIVLVTALSVAAFGIPLGVIIQRLDDQEALVRLDREVTAATIEVPVNFRTERDEVEFSSRNGADYSLYLPDGHRFQGTGPATADALVRQAMRGSVAEGRMGGRLVVAVPVFSREGVIATLRGSRTGADLRGKILRSWVGMGVLGVVIVGLAAAVAVGLARRLDRPVEELVRVATEMGGGDFAVKGEHSGIAELDRAIDALGATAARLGAVVERERAFSADASHQLRTPLTGLRVNLDELQQARGPDERLDRALVEVERLDRTITDLLALARDRLPPGTPLDLDAVMTDLERRWRWPLERRERALVVRPGAGLPAVLASGAAVSQILDVLVSNALQHGAGTVTVTAREVADSLAVDVTDEGPDVIADPDRLFVRRSSDRPGHGIGLALARTLAEAEGGRLLLRAAGPGPTFTVLFPSADPEPPLPRRS